MYDASLNQSSERIKEMMENQASAAGKDKLAAALVAARAEMPTLVKNANNPHLKNDYADLPTTIATVTPVLSKHGLVLTQFPGMLNADCTKIALTNILLHAPSGQSLAFTMEMPCSGAAKKDGTVMPPTAQTVGSAITYARRYSYQAICGLAAVDDDGNAASGVGPAPEPEAPKADIGALLQAIEAYEPGEGQVEKFEAEIRPRVADANDEDVVKAYTKKRKALKAWKPAA